MQPGISNSMHPEDYLKLTERIMQLRTLDIVSKEQNREVLCSLRERCPPPPEDVQEIASSTLLDDLQIFQVVSLSAVASQYTPLVFTRSARITIQATRFCAVGRVEGVNFSPPHKTQPLRA